MRRRNKKIPQNKKETNRRMIKVNNIQANIDILIKVRGVK